MTKDNSTRYGYAGYKKFKKVFKKYEWKHDTLFEKSLFGTNDTIPNRTEIHASIIAFKGDGMIIHNPISYLLVMIYVKKYIKRHFVKRQQRVEW